jgi:hypothetical protein
MDQRTLHVQKSRNNPKRIGFLLVVIFSVMSLSSYAQSNFSWGLSGGYDKTFNHFTGMNYTNTDALPDFNFGVDGILKIGDRFRLKAEVHYSNLSFTRKYNFESLDDKRIDFSNLAIHNLGLTPKIDYRLASAGKLDIYASAGVKFEFALGKYERSLRADGEQTTKNFITDSYKQTQIGAVGGFVFKYNLSDFTAITLMPEYTYFFDKFYSKNDFDMQRVGVNLGVEWRF